MEQRRRKFVPKCKFKKGAAVRVARRIQPMEEMAQSVGPEELEVAGEVLTDAELADIIRRVKDFLEPRGPSQVEELQQLLSARQVRLLQAAFGGLAAFLTSNHSFYQLEERNYTFVYFLSPDFEWLAPSPPDKEEKQEEDSPSVRLFLSREDIPRAKKEDGLGEEDVGAAETRGVWSTWPTCVSLCDTDSSGSGSYVTALEQMEAQKKEVKEEEEEVKEKEVEKGEKKEEEAEEEDKKKQVEEVKKKEEEENRRDVGTQTALPYWEWREMSETETQTDAALEHMDPKLQMERSKWTYLIKASLKAQHVPEQPQGTISEVEANAVAVGSSTGREMREPPVGCDKPRRRRRRVAPQPPPPVAEPRATSGPVTEQQKQQPAASSEPSEFRPSRPHGDRVVRRSSKPQGVQNPRGGRRNLFSSFQARPVAASGAVANAAGFAVSSAVGNVTRNAVGNAVSGAADNVAGHGVGGGLGGAVASDPSGLHNCSEAVTKRQEEDQRQASDKENVLRQRVGGPAWRNRGGGRMRRYWHGRPLRNRQNVPAASATQGSPESVAKQPPAKPAVTKAGGPVAPPPEPSRPLSSRAGERALEGTGSLDFHWHIEEDGPTSVHVDAPEPEPGNSTPKSKAESQLERVVMCVKEKMPGCSESEIRRCMGAVRQLRGGYSGLTLRQIAEEVLKHMKGGC